MKSISKPNRNDISIGKDKWITFIELDGRQTNAIELDDIFKPIESFLNSLETDCVAACCGIDAYGLWPEEIVRAARASSIPELPDLIETVREQIIDTDADSFVSHRMNNYFDRETLVQLIDHIAHCVRHADNVGEQSGEPQPPNTRDVKSWVFGGGPVTAAIRSLRQLLHGYSADSVAHGWWRTC